MSELKAVSRAQLEALLTSLLADAHMRVDAEAKAAPMEVKVMKPCVCCDEEAKDGEKTPGGESSTSSEDVFICIDEVRGRLGLPSLSFLSLQWEFRWHKYPHSTLVEEEEKKGCFLCHLRGQNVERLN